MVQIFHQLVVAPDEIRDEYRDLPAGKRVTALARMRIATTRPVAEQAVLEALKTLAVRCQSRTAEHERLGHAARPACHHRQSRPARRLRGRP